MNENHCALYRPKLQRFADGELGGAESRDLRTHLLDCLDCRAIVGEVVSLRKFFRDEPIVAAAPSGFAARVAARAFAEGPKSIEERTVLPFAKKVAAIAAAAVLVASVVFFYQSGAGKRVGFEAQAGSPGKVGAAIEKFRKARVQESAPSKQR